MLPGDPAEMALVASGSPVHDLSASDQPLYSDAATLNLDRPQTTIKVKIKPLSLPLPHSVSPPQINLNLERPRIRSLASRANPPDVIDLTHPSKAHDQLNLDRPHLKAGSDPSLTTPPTSINLERPLCKAKSTQSYEGFPPSDKSLFTAERGVTIQEWADDKLDFPRTKVSDAFSHIFGDEPLQGFS